MERWEGHMHYAAGRPSYDRAELATVDPRDWFQGSACLAECQGRGALYFTNPVPDPTRTLAIEHQESSSMHRWTCTC